MYSKKCWFRWTISFELESVYSFSFLSQFFWVPSPKTDDRMFSTTLTIYHPYIITLFSSQNVTQIFYESEKSVNLEFASEIIRNLFFKMKIFFNHTKTLWISILKIRKNICLTLFPSWHLFILRYPSDSFYWDINPFPSILSKFNLSRANSNNRRCF